MLRRTLFARATSLNKGVQNPGPTLHSWGRSLQKRRLEYETVDSKYHKREFNKNWDVAGCLQRTTDFLEMRVYFNYPLATIGWTFNLIVGPLYAFMPTGGLIIATHYVIEEYDRRMQRAAWF